MPKFLCKWHETVYREKIVEAESIDAAYAAVLEGNVLEELEPEWEELETQIDSVEELKESVDA